MGYSPEAAFIGLVVVARIVCTSGKIIFSRALGWHSSIWIESHMSVCGSSISVVVCFLSKQKPEVFFKVLHQPDVLHLRNQ